MEILNDNIHLLFIEPKKEDKSLTAIHDELTQIMRLALQEAKSGIGSPDKWYENTGYRGWHTTDCGQTSSNCNYLLKNGMVTNSLAIYYLQYYRNVIPESEMVKVMDLYNFYKNNKPC